MITRDEQRRKAANEAWMPESAHNKIWQDGAKRADEYPVITANLFRQCIFMLNEACYEQGTGVDGIDIDYAIKKYDLK